jgi:hypothetical protein
MLALVYQRVPGAQVTFIETTDIVAKVEAVRPGGKCQVFQFTIEDAKQASLVKPNSPWVKYPAAMLRARVISAMARAVFPDAIMGCYTPEELDPEAQIDVADTVVSETKKLTSVAQVVDEVAPPEDASTPTCESCGQTETLMVSKQNAEEYWCNKYKGGCGHSQPR